jgi:hypothetical protein
VVAVVDWAAEAAAEAVSEAARGAYTSDALVKNCCNWVKPHHQMVSSGGFGARRNKVVDGLVGWTVSWLNSTAIGTAAMVEGVSLSRIHLSEMSPTHAENAV